MNAAECAALAAKIKAMRQVSEAAGIHLKGQDVEILLWIAAGVDSVRALVDASGLGIDSVRRSVRLLSGRPINKGLNRRRPSPFRLVDTRPHPHLPYPERQVFLTQSPIST